jgi:hypothetical protein
MCASRSLTLFNMLLLGTIACMSGRICAPQQGTIWTQGGLGSIIWNSTQMAPFEQYDRVDVYVVDDGSSGRSYTLKEYVQLNDNFLVTSLDAGIFPEDLPANRSCHLTFTRNGDAIDSDKTLNSPSFFMIRKHTRLYLLFALSRER